MSDEDPSILHFLLAGGDEVRIPFHEMSAALERALTVHCQATRVAAFIDLRDLGETRWAAGREQSLHRSVDMDHHYTSNKPEA